MWKGGEKMLTNSRLVIVFETGVDSKGEPTFKTKSFNNIKTDATDAQLLAAAEALTPLQGWISNKVERNNVYSLA